jgi:cytochrome c-type biogenesis protein
MVKTLLVVMLAPLWLGLLTSVSPCQLATNIAAISYLGNRGTRSKRIIPAALLYTLGRMLVYLGLAILIITSLLSIVQVSNSLQRIMNLLSGPLLLLIGLVLLEIIRLPWLESGGPPPRLQQWVDNSGIWGAGLLGIFFALAFCPISAALYFGSLIPLAVENRSYVIAPLLFGIGTAVPVIFFALLFAFSMQRANKLFQKMAGIELWMRRITAAILILVGLYWILSNNLHINLGF